MTKTTSKKMMKISTKVPSYDDFWWDRAKAKDRERMVLEEQLKPVLLFAKEYVPFYREHYQGISEQDIQGMGSFSDFVSLIPTISKDHLSKNEPQAFMPQVPIAETEPRIGHFWKFGTGGTTTRPIQVLHSMEEWRGMMMTLQRAVDYDLYQDKKIAKKFDIDVKSTLLAKSAKNPLQGARIYGAYNADHITNNIYGSMFTNMGAHMFGRASTKPDVQENYDLIQSLKVSGILAPPEDPTGRQTKGLTLASFLELDAQNSSRASWKLSHRYNEDFKFVFWSSMPISKELSKHLTKDRLIPYVKGHFGSTEVCPTGSTCSAHDRKFHMDYGHTLVLTKKEFDAGIAGPDKLGYTVVSKIGAVNKDGQIVLPSGMLFINYLTGDAARLTKGEKCSCGRTTPVLHDVQRAQFKEGKARHGCQTG